MKDLDPKKFEAFKADVKDITNKASKDIPFFIKGEREVWINGTGEDGYEDFVLTQQKTDFQCCKTARKPYDDVVTAVLLAAKKHFRDDIEITSDGYGDDWSKGQELCQAACGYGDGGYFFIGDDGVEINPPPPDPEWYDGGNQ